MSPQLARLRCASVWEDYWMATYSAEDRVRDIRSTGAFRRKCGAGATVIPLWASVVWRIRDIFQVTASRSPAKTPERCCSVARTE